MNYMKGKNKDIYDVTSTEIPDQQKAIDILFGDKYHQSKIEIMRPINKFLEELDNRTQKKVNHQAFLLKIFLCTQILTFTLIVCIVVFLMRTAKQYHTSMVNLLSLAVKEKTAKLTDSNKALIDSEERFRNLSDASFEGIAITEKGSILESNNAMAQMFGYDTIELVGMEATDLVTLDVRKEVQNNILSGNENSYETIGLTKDGNRFPIGIHAKMFLYKGRRVKVTAIRDLTEQKKAEEEIKKLQGILPICASCKKIRDDKGYWNQVEAYIEQHSEAQFTHGMCEECAEKYYGDQKWYNKIKNRCEKHKEES